MRKRLHVLFGKAGVGVALDPWPGPNVGDRIFTLTLTSQIVAGFACVLARQLDFEYAVDAEGFVPEALNGICLYKHVQPVLASGDIDRMNGRAQDGQGRKTAKGKWRHTGDLFLCVSSEMVSLALIRSAAAVPEKQPLQGLVALEFVREPELVLFVNHFQQVEKFG